MLKFANYRITTSLIWLRGCVCCSLFSLMRNISSTNCSTAWKTYTWRLLLCLNTFLNAADFLKGSLTVSWRPCSHAVYSVRSGTDRVWRDTVRFTAAPVRYNFLRCCTCCWSPCHLQYLRRLKYDGKTLWRYFPVWMRPTGVRTDHQDNRIRV